MTEYQQVATDLLLEHGARAPVVNFYDDEATINNRIAANAERLPPRVGDRIHSLIDRPSYAERNLRALCTVLASVGRAAELRSLEYRDAGEYAELLDLRARYGITIPRSATASEMDRRATAAKVDAEEAEQAGTHYVVQTAAAPMPSSCWGEYRRVAVLEIDARLASVAIISDHATGCVRVVETWEKLNVGVTDRCAYEVALTEAREVADRLNGN